MRLTEMSLSLGSVRTIYWYFRINHLVVVRLVLACIALQIPETKTRSKPGIVDDDFPDASRNRAAITRQWTILPSSAKSRQSEMTHLLLLRIHPPVELWSGALTNAAGGSINGFCTAT